MAADVIAKVYEEAFGTMPRERLAELHQALLDEIALLETATHKNRDVAAAIDAELRRRANGHASAAEADHPASGAARTTGSPRTPQFRKPWKRRLWEIIQSYDDPQFGAARASADLRQEFPGVRSHQITDTLRYWADRGSIHRSDDGSGEGRGVYRTGMEGGDPG